MGRALPGAVAVAAAAAAAAAAAEAATAAAAGLRVGTSTCLGGWAAPTRPAPTASPRSLTGDTTGWQSTAGSLGLLGGPPPPAPRRRRGALAGSVANTCWVCVCRLWRWSPSTTWALPFCGWPTTTHRRLSAAKSPAHCHGWWGSGLWTCTPPPRRRSRGTLQVVDAHTPPRRRRQVQGRWRASGLPAKGCLSAPWWKARMVWRGCFGRWTTLLGRIGRHWQRWPPTVTLLWPAPPLPPTRPS